MSVTATSRLGTVVRDAEGVRLEFERTFDGISIEEVWDSVTDPDRLARWFGRWTGDPTTGTVQMTPSEQEGAAEPEPVDIDECDPPRLLAVTVNSPDGPWPLVVNLSQQATGTTLHFVHHLAEPYDASSVGPGWQFYLDRLTAVITGDVLPEDFEAYHPALAEAYAVPPP